MARRRPAPSSSEEDESPRPQVRRRLLAGRRPVTPPPRLETPEPVEGPLPCQRCFFRLQSHPDHECETLAGRTKCTYCSSVKHSCVPLPSEVQTAARTALDASPARARVPQVRIIEQNVKRLTRAANKAKKAAAAAEATEVVGRGS
ncbi:hypothetical protein CBS147308_10340 [Penicillium roqueforti]|nr:hypothetical protein CBS147308_10340 [Penicillium roqueforti]